MSKPGSMPAKSITPKTTAATMPKRTEDNWITELPKKKKRRQSAPAKAGLVMTKVGGKGFPGVQTVAEEAIVVNSD
jgi:hypothetical protein